MSTKKPIPLSILENITNGFSADSIIGMGGYGNVYKGVYEGRDIAVKLLHVDPVRGLDDHQFKNEVGNLLRVEHPNIVQLVGYCYETKNIYVEHNGANNFSQHIHRVICFEYLQGGSLDKHLCDKSFAPCWGTRYNIIKGVCEGLNFLHKCEPHICHLDLKPANILLDSSMEPKLADFGLSRLFTRSHTHVTEKVTGTRKYMPPESIGERKISLKNDVFSLGIVMIEIMIAPAGYSNSLEMVDMAQLTQQVLDKWSTMIEPTSKYRSEELSQVEKCIELAKYCVDSEKDNRPTVADILDTLNKTETGIPKKQTADVLLYRTIGPRSTEPNPLKTMIVELDNRTNQHEHCSYMPEDSSNRSVQQIPERETSSDVVEKLIIGRTEEKQKILSILSASIRKRMVILPIYGIGGIGKTTLAQLVFNDKQFQGYSRVWVYVSQEFDLNKIGNSIISQLTNKSSNISNKQMLHKRLKELFDAKSILIVLDDLWEENPKELDKLKVMLGLGLGSKVIIVTTRDGGLARKFCSPAVAPYKLKTLTVDECWTIIKQKADFDDRIDQEQLEHIGWNIATKCGGVALAAQSLGYMLNGMRSDEWESVRDSHIWNLSSTEGHEVLASLQLSYSHMSDWLKLCFSYCAIFPKGHKIEKYYIIYQWIALGFIEQSRIFDIIQLSENYVKQLLGMSFLQYSKTPLSDRNQHKDATLFTMHDLVHDLAKEILSHQLNTGGNKCRYASLTDCSKPLQFLVYIPANIKALRFQDCGQQEFYHGAFSSAKCLRVLDLSECYIGELPDCIGQLKQLRFLHAPRIHNFEIPNCITNLSELNYPNLRGSPYISALPKSIGDMKGLMHLDLSDCHELGELLPESFSELKQLVHLDLSALLLCRGIDIKALRGCTKLQYLNLSYQVFHERVTGLPEVIGNLINLRYLNLSECLPWHPYGPTRSIWMDEIYRLLGSISTLSNLEHLNLSGNQDISRIPESIEKLSKLHTLDLSGCRFLLKLPDSIFKMVSLKVLIYWSDQLRESTLPRLNFALLPDFVVHASSDKCSSNISLLQPTNPRMLKIDKLENVKSAEEARSVILVDKQKIHMLTFEWTLGAERSVDDKVVLENLVPPSSVHDLYITGYRSHSIPDWFMDIRQYLPNLSSISLCGFPNCNNDLLPPLGQLPNLEVLFLCRMEGLEEWNTTHYSGKEGSNELMFPNLETLSIEQCPKLRINPCLLGASCAEGKCLSIKDCDNMLSSWGESSTRISASSSYRITELSVQDSKVPMHHWRLLYHIHDLYTLVINACSDLRTSTDMTKHLSSIDLRCLQLVSLDQAELPNWLAKLTSLEKLTLEGCESMTSLPQWLEELTSLKEIEVNGCTKLEKWFKSKENKKFIDDIGVTVTGIEEDWSWELGEASDDSDEEETTNSEDTASSSQMMNNQRKMPREDGVSNRSSPPPTRMAPRAGAISDDDADDMSIIGISDDDKPTVSAPARPARPTPCTLLGLVIASSPATSLVGDGAEVELLPRPANTLTSATYNADDEVPLLDSSSGSWASLQRARKGKGKQNETDLLVDLMDVPISKRSSRPLELWGQDEETTLFPEAASTVARASASSPPTLSFDLNVAASASSPPVLSFDFNVAAGASSPPVSSLDLNSPWV